MQWHAHFQQENHVSSFTATSVQDTSHWKPPHESLYKHEPNFLESRRALSMTTNSTTDHTVLNTDDIGLASQPHDHRLATSLGPASVPAGRAQECQLPCSGGKASSTSHPGRTMMWVFSLHVWNRGENPTWGALQHPCTILGKRFWWGLYHSPEFGPTEPKEGIMNQKCRRNGSECSFSKSGGFKYVNGLALYHFPYECIWTYLE